MKSRAYGEKCGIFLRCVRTDLKRAFTSPGFFLAVLLLVAVNYASVADEYTHVPGASLVYLYSTFVLRGPFAIAFMFFAVLPYGTSFCNDWKSQYIKSCVVRSSLSTYAWSRVTVVFLSGFLAVFAGNLLTAALLSLHTPMLGSEIEQMGYNVFDDTILGDIALTNVGGYLVLKTVFPALSCAGWAVLGLCVSAWVPSALMTLAVPSLAFYLVQSFLPLPTDLAPHRFLYGIFLEGTPVEGLATAVLLTAGIVAVLGAVFCRKVRRKMAGI